MKKSFYSLTVLLTLMLGGTAQAAHEGPLRVGHPKLPEGCHGAAEIDAAQWQAYLSLLGERLSRTVVGCGAEPAAAGVMLSSGDLDFALVRHNPKSADAEGLRPILRAREKEQLPRTEIVLLVGPTEEERTTEKETRQDQYKDQGPPSVDNPLYAAFSMQETVALAAIENGLRLDEEKAAQRAQLKLMELGKVPGPDGPLIEPLEGLKKLANGSASSMLLTHGRLDETCRRFRDACESINMAWRGFVPISTAYAVSKDLGRETLYRLIGIHVALHLSHPEFVTILGGERAVEMEPTEESAFVFRSTLN